MKRKIAIIIDMENAAFDEDPVPELKRMLYGIVDRIEEKGWNYSHLLRDINGNVVGFYECYKVECDGKH